VQEIEQLVRDYAVARINYYAAYDLSKNYRTKMSYYDERLQELFEAYHLTDAERKSITTGAHNLVMQITNGRNHEAKDTPDPTSAGQD